MKSKEFKVRFEELPALGEFVESSYLRDKELFAAFSPVYANGFAENYHSKLLEVKNAVMPKVLTGKRKRITEELHQAQQALLIYTEEIKQFCSMAGTALSFKIEDLNLSGIRQVLRCCNSEASIRQARILQQILANDQAILTEKGFNAEKLNNLIESIEKLNLEQNTTLNERKHLVEANLNLFNDFWRMLQETLQSGQLIHRDNPVRKQEYTEKNLMSRIRVMVSQKKKPEEDVNIEQPIPAEKPLESPPVAA